MASPLALVIKRKAKLGQQHRIPHWVYISLLLPSGLYSYLLCLQSHGKHCPQRAPDLGGDSIGLFFFAIPVCPGPHVTEKYSFSVRLKRLDRTPGAVAQMNGRLGHWVYSPPCKLLESLGWFVVEVLLLLSDGLTFALIQYSCKASGLPDFISANPSHLTAQSGVGSALSLTLITQACR